MKAEDLFPSFVLFFLLCSRKVEKVQSLSFTLKKNLIENYISLSFSLLRHIYRHVSSSAFVLYFYYDSQFCNNLFEGKWQEETFASILMMSLDFRIAFHLDDFEILFPSVISVLLSPLIAHAGKFNIKQRNNYF